MIAQDNEPKKGAQPHSVNGAAVGVGALAALGGLFGLIGHATKLEVPPDSVGLAGKAGTVSVVSPGDHWFGKIKYPNCQFIRPGEARRQVVELTFTPGTLDKLASFGRESLIVNLLPVIGPYTRERLTSHLRVQLQLDYKLPPTEGLDKMLAYAGSSDFEGQGVSKACYRALLPEEGKIARKIFAPKNEKLETLVAAKLTEALGIEVRSVKVLRAERFQVNAGDLVAEYRSLHREAFVVHEK